MDYQPQELEYISDNKLESESKTLKVYFIIFHIQYVRGSQLMLKNSSG